MTVSPSYRSTASRRSILPSPLASAIVGSLLMAAALPALAQDSNADALSRYQFQRSLQAAFAAPVLTASPSLKIIAADVEVDPEPIMGKPGDAASWRTTEFNSDWGLQAINADVAYARGLTGAGIRLGVFDSGTGLDHPEFAGKDNRSIRIADLLPDGTRCTNTSAVGGPDACFASDGDDVQISYVGYNDNVPDNIRAIIEAGPYVQPGIQFEIHGTHVAGTIAANRDGSGMHGVSFGSDLTVGRLFSDSISEWQRTATGYSVVTLGAIGPDVSAFEDLYAQMNAQGVRAINHSWGLSNEPSTAEDMDSIYNDPADREYLNTFADGSRARGMIQVWAAGNTDSIIPTPEQSPIAGIYATLPRAFADIEPYWLSVVNVGTDLTLSNRSNKCGLSANWCLAAPGSDIVSTAYGDDSTLAGSIGVDANGNVSLDILERVPTYGYTTLSGTSMAAPHVTGALGLLFERFPYLDSAQVRDVLLTTTTDLGAPGIDDIYGWGLINLAKAIEGYGSLRVDTDVVMNQKAGGLKVWEGDAWDDWTNDIGGPGKLTKSGIGWLRLSGDNSFNGAVVREGVLELDGVNTLTSAVDVTGGTFLLNGTLQNTALNSLGGNSRITTTGVLDGSDLTVTGGVVSFNGVQTGGSTFVGEKGTLKGVGQLGDTTVAGIIAPGNSIGTLTINGDYVQTATGVYQAEVAPGSRSDQLHVTGTATLGGTLVALPEPGIYYLGEQFNFIQADGGVNGQFATTDFSAFSPFMQFSLAYTAAGARIEVTRGNALATSATTANQLAVATVADGLAVNQGLPRPLTMLFPEQVGSALDSLSGELHAATSVALLESSRYVRDAALARRAGAAAPGAEGGDATGVWVQALAGSTTLDGNTNTARTEANSNGLLVGADREFGGWQVGVLAGTGRTDVKQGEGRRAKSKVDNTHFGAYASHNWGGFGLRGGLAWSEHEVDSTRELAFAGYSDTLSARYDARTRQAFIEAAYRFGGREAGLEPYLQVARVEVDTKHVNERGGAAALQGSVDDVRTTLATAGVRFDKGLKASFQQDSWLHVRGAVAYRHASGDRNPAARLGFASGGDSFVVNGAPIADSAVVAELGLSAWLTAKQQLELGYSGQFGDESRDHGANLRWSVRF
ncbi:autotransporter domain-containing protein [Stenotrophomonas sp. S48]|uniref:autotransporter domain-containing protein n=1 Tax=unclassified Stenotrophomonas TaxID=196198 RepID=UPI001902805F|nr:MULTISPECIES: autotransporter serine protease [unclassified Stenotrophomonas]MBK0027662.1 autotransporter domain-containing protein [Stenotrophomonas sp. S48]MBK0049815.1 autotransporter domain-containing protein [Stenotrophomonas sp. S49]